MATTSPDNIQYPVNSDQVAPLASHFKNLADSTQAALNTKADTADLPTLVTQLEALDYAKFDTTYTGGSTQPGMVSWNDTDGTLEFQLKGGNVTLQIGQEQVVRVKNDTGATLSNGKAVYISGSNGNNLLADYANATSEPKSSGTIGITTEDINSNGHGYVTTFGLVRNINTAGLTEGAPVWLSTTDGGFTSTRPTAPNHSVVLGFCLRASATVGVIFVRVDNGWELDELHNVLISSPVNGQALTYDNGVWKNATPVSSLAGLSDVQLGSLSPNEVLKYNGTKWVNGTAAGGVTAAATAPDLVAAKQGDAWFDTNDGTLYVCYIDGDSTKQWVQVQANSALEASILSRLGALESQAIAYGQMSPNYVINGGFDIWQRGTSFTNIGTQVLNADRWKLTSSVLNGNVTQSTDVPNTSFKYSAQLSPYSNGTPGEFAMRQLFEMQHIRNIAGNPVTISFWVKCSKTALKIRLEPYNATGGIDTTQSASVDANVWTRVSKTFTNLANVTAWTSADNAVALSMDIGFADNTAMTTSDYLRITGVQLERGSIATAFRRNAPSIQAELAACQRYYEVVVPPSGFTGAGFVNSATSAYVTLPFKVTKRASATVSYVGTLSGITALWTGGGSAATAFSAPNGTDQSYATITTSGLSAGQAIFFQTSAAVSIVANAEL